MNQGSINDRIILILAAVTLIKGVVFAFTIPVFKAPDENSHFMYITYIQENHALPYIRFEGVPYDYEFWGSLKDERDTRRGFDGKFYSEVNPRVKNFIEENGYASIPVENFQLPLYYIICAAGSIFNSGNLSYVLYSSRVISVLFGVGLVWVSYLISRQAFPMSRFMIYGLPLIISFNPQFTFNSSTLGNDVPAAFFVSLILLQVISMFKNGVYYLRHFFYLGITFGLAAITKLSVLTVMPVIFLFLTGIICVKHKEDVGSRVDTIKSIAIFFLASGTIVIAPFLHNYLAYGELTGTKLFADYWHHKVSYWSFDYDNTSIIRMLFSVWSIRLIDSFWAAFGWMEIWLPRIFYYIFYVLMIIGVVGLIKIFLETFKNISKTEKQQRYIFLFFISAILSELVFFLKFIHDVGGTMGHGSYFFIVLVPLMFLMLCGIQHIFQQSERGLALTFYILCLGMIFINAISYLRIASYYYPSRIEGLFADTAPNKFPMSEWTFLILTVTYLSAIILLVKEYLEIDLVTTYSGRLIEDS